MKRFVAVAALAGASFAAVAADNVGFSVGAELQYKWLDGKAYGSEPGNSYSKSLENENATVGALNASYGFAVTPSFIMQLGGTLDLNKTDAYQYKAGAGSFADDLTFSERAKMKEENHYSLYIAPGYLVTPSTMIYAKLAYHSMKGKVSYSNSDGDSFKDSKNFSGIGYGVGVRSAFSKNFFGYAELQQVDYGKETVFTDGDYKYKVKPDSLIGTIGLGYNF